MTLDQLISVLEDIRSEHHGRLHVYAGEDRITDVYCTQAFAITLTPSGQKYWAGPAVVIEANGSEE
jgi:hypothetical protein